MSKQLRRHRVPAWLLALLIAVQGLLSATPAAAAVTAVSATGNGNAAGQGASNPYFSVQFTTGAGFNVGDAITLTFPDGMLVTDYNQLTAAEIGFGTSTSMGGITGSPTITSAGGRQSLVFPSPIAVPAGEGVRVRLYAKNSGGTFRAHTVVNPPAAGTYDIGVSTPAEPLVTGAYVVGPPSIITLAPNTVGAGYPATSLAVTGSNTHFVSGTTSLRILDRTSWDYTGASTVTITDATHATINLAAGLGVGSYTVHLGTNGGEDATAPLTVVTPAITTLAPTTVTVGYPAGTPVAVAGAYTHFVSGTTALTILSNSSPNPPPAGSTLTVTDATHATVGLAAGMMAGSYTIRLDTGTEQVGATVTVSTSAQPTISLAPGTLGAGYPATSVAATGTGTHFAAGTNTLAIVNSSNVDVTGASTVTVTDATHATINVAPGLALGSYTVHLGATGEDAAGPLTVTTPSMTLAPPALTAGYANNTALAVTGTYTNFGSATTLTVLNSANTDVKGASTLTVTDATHATVNLAAGLAAGTYTVHLISGAQDVSAPLTVNPAPTITLAPNTLTVGYANTTLAVTGSITHFAAGTTTLVILNSANTDVKGTSTVAITDATHATVNLAAGLAVGSYTVRLDTAGEQAGGTLAVNPPPLTVAPESLPMGYAATSLALSGFNTHFAAGSTTLAILDSNGTDVKGTSTLTVTDATHATVDLAAGLAVGTYTVRLSSPGEQVMAGLYVDAPPVAWISLGPSGVDPTYANNTPIRVGGTDTHFTSTTSLKILNSSNADVTGASTLTVTDATHATVNLAAGLAAGRYAVHLVSGAEDVPATLSVGVAPDYWPVCATPTSQNCIQEFKLDGAPAPAQPPPAPSSSIWPPRT